MLTDISNQRKVFIVSCVTSTLSALVILVSGTWRSGLTSTAVVASAFETAIPHGGWIVAFCAFNLLCAPCFAAMGTIRQQQRSAKWFWITIGYMCGFAWCVGCMLYQFVGLALGEVSFGIWTVVAIIIAALMLFQLFRPMPNYDKKDEKVARKLETENEAA